MNKKKLKKSIKKPFKIIYNILDKLIVTPLSRLIYRISKIIKKNAGKLDKILNKPNSLIVFSLMIAVIIFLLINSRSINIIETESEIISEQPVSVTYNKEKYVVEGIPESVDIILMGRKSDLYLAKHLGEHKVELDLSDYKTGEFTVKLKYNHQVETISYKLVPSNINVKISEKESAVKTLSYDLLNQDKLDKKLNISEVNLQNNEVYVKGSKATLERVATVKALIDVAKLDYRDAGTYNIDTLPMIAYDKKGNLVENVEIVPKTAKAEIKIDSYYIDLPVKVVPKGELAKGYAISTAVSSVKSVRVYGDQEEISKLSYIPAEIDVDNLSEDKKYNVTLTKPVGVRHMSEATTNIEVKISGESSIEIPGISIETKNLGSAYVANPINREDTECTAIVKGVTSVLNNLKSTSLKAYVDLSGKGPGTYEVPVKVTGDDLTLNYFAKVKTIQIKISNKN